MIEIRITNVILGFFFNALAFFVKLSLSLYQYCNISDQEAKCRVVRAYTEEIIASE